jgi:hypothetical protein
VILLQLLAVDGSEQQRREYRFFALVARGGDPVNLFLPVRRIARRRNSAISRGPMSN